MDKDAVWRVVEEERRSLADLLESLDHPALRTPSLCDAWSVRDVFAHLTVSPLSRPRDVFAGFARARGRFDRAVLLATEPFLAPQRRLGGLELIATDSAFRVGRGRPVRGRTQDLLLLLTGRYARLAALSGEGAESLVARPALRSG